jgi:hypothetical protein
MTEFMLSDWCYRVPGTKGGCDGEWDHGEWSNWCQLDAGHDGPHQDGDLSGRDSSPHVTLWEN